MIFPVGRHLVESTIFAILIMVTIECLRSRSAALRYSLLLAAVGKFAIPLHIFVVLGERLKGYLPSAPIAFSVPTIDSASASSALSPLVFSVGLAEIATLIWISGATFFLTEWFQKMAGALPGADSSSTGDFEMLHRMQALLAMKRTVRLVTSSSDVEPRLIGIFRHTIILPAGLSERLSPVEIEGVLLHELAHAKRWDNLARSIVHAVVCIFWFHPLVWFLEKKLSAECEIACDEVVLTAGVPPKEYIEGILKVCQMYLQRPVPGSSNVSGSNFKQRMDCIMSYRRFKSNSSFSIVGVIVLAGLAVAALVAGFGMGKRVVAQSTGSTLPSSAGMCTWAGKLYPKGTIVRIDGRPPLKMCTIAGEQPTWVTVTDESQDQDRAIVELTSPPPVMCKATAPQGKFCTCEDKLFSPGSVVGSERGPLACPASGGKWQSFIGKQTPWPPAPISSH